MPSISLNNAEETVDNSGLAAFNQVRINYISWSITYMGYLIKLCFLLDK